MKPNIRTVDVRTLRTHQAMRKPIGEAIRAEEDHAFLFWLCILGALATAILLVVFA